MSLFDIYKKKKKNLNFFEFFDVNIFIKNVIEKLVIGFLRVFGGF